MTTALKEGQAAGKLNSPGLPKNRLQLAAGLCNLVGHEVYAADLSVARQRFLAATLGYEPVPESTRQRVAGL